MKKTYFFIFLFLASCGSYYQIGSLYNKGHFSEAYDLLKKQKQINNKYKIYELKLVLQMVLKGEKNFLPLLDDILVLPAPKNAEDIHRFAHSWLRFISAQSQDDFKNVLEVLPTVPLKEFSFERARLAVQNQSLLKLERYKEIVYYLEGKTGKAPDLIYLLATAQKNLKEYEKAEKNYEDSLQYSENNILKGLIYFHLGEIYENTQQNNKAQKSYFTSWQLAQNNAVLNFKLGRLLSQYNYENLPQRFYRAALRLDENHAEAWYYLNLQ